MDSLLCERHCRPQLGCRQRDDDDEAEPQLAAFNKQRGDTRVYCLLDIRYTFIFFIIIYAMRLGNRRCCCWPA
jgi:hypothetical protein